MAGDRESNGRAPGLPEAELEVLSHLRLMRQATAADLRALLERRRPLTHASVMTLLERLRERGLVARRRADVGKAYIYHPTRRAESAVQRTTQRFLDRAFNNDAVSMVSALFGSRRPTPREIAGLRELVARLEERGAQ